MIVWLYYSSLRYTYFLNIYSCISTIDIFVVMKYAYLHLSLLDFTYEIWNMSTENQDTDTHETCWTCFLLYMSSHPRLRYVPRPCHSHAPDVIFINFSILHSEHILEDLKMFVKNLQLVVVHICSFASLIIGFWLCSKKNRSKWFNKYIVRCHWSLVIGSTQFHYHIKFEEESFWMLFQSVIWLATE